MVGFVVVVLIMAAGVSIAIAHLRWDARIRAEAAKRPIEMTRADYLSQLRNDASWDSQPGPGHGHSETRRIASVFQPPARSSPRPSKSTTTTAGRSRSSAIGMAAATPRTPS